MLQQVTCSWEAPANQVAESRNLHLAGRRVHLCVGGAPRTSRRCRSRDVVDWRGGEVLPHPRARPSDERKGRRAKPITMSAGRDGGRDIKVPKVRPRRTALWGTSATCKTTRCTSPLISRANLDQADASNGIKTAIDAYIEANGVEAPSEARYQPAWAPEGR